MFDLEEETTAVLIVGAGPAGMTTAFALQKYGIAALPAATRCTGRSRVPHLLVVALDHYC